jgi:hypothetical protein
MALLARWEGLRERMNRLNRESNRLGGPEEALTTTTLAPPVDIRIPDSPHRSSRAQARKRKRKSRTSVVSNGNAEAYPLEYAS